MKSHSNKSGNTRKLVEKKTVHYLINGRPVSVVVRTYAITLKVPYYVRTTPDKEKS